MAWQIDLGFDFEMFFAFRIRVAECFTDGEDFTPVPNWKT